MKKIKFPFLVLALFVLTSFAQIDGAKYCELIADGNKKFIQVQESDHKIRPLLNAANQKIQYPAAALEYMSRDGWILVTVYVIPANSYVTSQTRYILKKPA